MRGHVLIALYTLDEVAERLRKSRRWLQDFIRVRPYYRLAGRTKLFSETDIARLVEALPCPSVSCPRAKVKRRTGTSVAVTSGSVLTAALELASEGSPKRSCENGNARSN